jgi:hypothetical protein
VIKLLVSLHRDTENWQHHMAAKLAGIACAIVILVPVCAVVAWLTLPHNP